MNMVNHPQSFQWDPVNELDSGHAKLQLWFYLDPSLRDQHPPLRSPAKHLLFTSHSVASAWTSAILQQSETRCPNWCQRPVVPESSRGGPSSPVANGPHEFRWGSGLGRNLGAQVTGTDCRLSTTIGLAHGPPTVNHP